MVATGPLLSSRGVQTERADPTSREWCGGQQASVVVVVMRRFLRRKGSQQSESPAEPKSELPCIVEAVEKLAAEMDGAQEILGKLQQACEEEERQQKASPPSIPPAGPKRLDFQIGQHVIVTGLQSATEHNGKVGKIESFRYEAHATYGIVIVRPCHFLCWLFP